MIGLHQFMDWQGKMLGRYRLLRLLGEGGMGEVWLAEDTELRRQVAAKLLPIVMASDRRYLDGFVHEARTAASLEHPHILPVHDFGEQRVSEGEIVTYLIMPYISGGTLRDRIQQRQGPFPQEEALSYLRQAAEAIDYAHSRHVMHRDIKPGNMLMQENWLFLADFGIAKLLSSSIRGQTRAGAGTPEYMAPEQVQGKAEPASDRYSLACLAYLLLTGQPPFKGETPYETLIKHVTSAPPPLRQFNPALPQGVEQAVLWGLAKHPSARPSTCVALVNAIEQGWNAQSLTTNPDDPDATLLGPQSRFFRSGYETQASASLAASGIPPYTHYNAGASSPTYSTLTTQHTHYPPTAQPGVPGMPGGPSGPQPPRKIGRRALIGGGVAAAALVVAAGGGGLYYALSQHPHPAPPKPKPIPGPKNLVRGIPLLILAGHSGSINAAAWSPDGRYLATGGEDTRILLWDVASYLRRGAGSKQTINTPLRNWKTANAIEPNGLAWSPDGHYIVSNNFTQGVFVIDATKESNTPIVTHANPGFLLYYQAVAWSPNAALIATPRTYDTQGAFKVDLWPGSRNGNAVRTLSYTVPRKFASNSAANIDSITWSADGAYVIALTDYGEIIVWDQKTGAVKQVIELPDRPNQEPLIYRDCLVASPANPRLILADDYDVGSIWDIQQKKLLLMVKPGVNYVKSATGFSWAPNGKYVAGGYTKSANVYIWDVQHPDPDPLHSAPRPHLYAFGSDLHTKPTFVIDVEWSPDGRYLAGTSDDGLAIVWKVDSAA